MRQLRDVRVKRPHLRRPRQSIGKSLADKDKDTFENWQRLEALASQVDAAFPQRKPPERPPYPGLPKRRALDARERWQSLVWSIDCAQAHGRDGLLSLTVALSRLIHASAMDALLLDAREFRKAPMEPSSLLWDERLPLTASGESMRDLLVKRSRAPTVDLTDTAVFPSPWERWRMHGALANLGEGREWGPWKQDKKNHFGVAWYPWPVVWVRNGNHSTMAALLRSRGTFKSSEAYDFAPVLRVVSTDGVNWIRTADSSVLAPVRSLPMAGIFIIGQRLIELEQRSR